MSGIGAAPVRPAGGGARRIVIPTTTARLGTTLRTMVASAGWSEDYVGGFLTESAAEDLEDPERLPFPPSGENLDIEDEDDAEVEKRLRAEREAEEEAVLAALADDDSS